MSAPASITQAYPYERPNNSYVYAAGSVYLLQDMFVDLRDLQVERLLEQEILYGWEGSSPSR